MDRAKTRQRILLEEDTLNVATYVHKTAFSLISTSTTVVALLFQARVTHTPVFWGRLRTGPLAALEP